MDKHVYGQSMDTSVGKDLQKFHIHLNMKHPLLHYGYR